MKTRTSSAFVAALMIFLSAISGAAFLVAVSISPTCAQDGAAASGATWYVDAAVTKSGDGTSAATAVRTIPEGLSLASPGDTVLAAAGVYTGAVAYGGTYTLPVPISIPAGVNLLGAGIGKSIIEGPVVGFHLVTLAEGSRLEGFTVRSARWSPTLTGVLARAGGAAVLHNRTEGTAVGIDAGCPADAGDCTEPLTVAFNTVAGSAMEGIKVQGDTKTTVRNNTVASDGIGIKLAGSAAVVENNVLVAENGVVCESEYQGAGAGGIVLRHNNFHASQYYPSGCPTGEANTDYDPLFRNAPQRDFRLTAGSPLRGRGTGGDDIGALPFTPVGSAPADVSVVALSGNTVKVEWRGQASAYDLFFSDNASAGGVYTRRQSVSAGASVVLTRENPLHSPMVAVSSVDAGGNGSELALSGTAEPLVLRNATIEQDSPLLWVDSAWQTVSNAAASGGSYLSNTQLAARIQIPFEGDTLVLGRRVGPQGGYAWLTIDGAPAGYLNFRFTEDRWRVPATLSGFGPGVHLLEIKPAHYPTTDPGAVNLDFVTAPSSFAASAAQMQAVERVNLYRTTAGLAPVRGDQAVHMAAQAHAEYYARNRSDPRLAGLGFHGEHADLPGYTGKSPSDRAQYFGYRGGVGEDGHFVGDPIRSVDGWMATVYHRNLIMCYDCTNMGYGGVAQHNNTVDVLNMGATDYMQPAARVIYTYPAGNQTHVPRLWDGGEIPDPLPGQPKPVGYPISLYIQQGAAPRTAAETEPPAAPIIRDAATVQTSAPAWSVTAAELYTEGGEQVPVIMLDQNTDVPKYLGSDVVFLIPRKPLAADTTYVAHIAGTDSQGVPFDHRWAFATGGALAAPDFSLLRAWADRPFPHAGETVTVHVHLANSGVKAEQVAVRATLPPQATYVPGSARTSQGSAAGNGPVDFAIGAIESGGSVNLQFAMAVSADARLPLALSPEIVVNWSMGRLTRTVSVIAGGEPLFLPALAR